MDIDLFNRCKKFEVLAGELSVAKVSKEENTDPVLKKLSELKNFDDRIKFAKKNWKLLGEGSSRTAFQINDDLIIKIAHNKKGLAQCLVEMDPKAQRECTNPVIVADPLGKWLVMKETKKLTKERFKEIVGFGFEPFMNALFFKFNNDSDKWKSPRDYEDIEKCPLFNCLAELIFETDQQVGDISKISSVRELDGKVVLVDYGLSRQVFDKMYSGNKTDSGTKTSE